MRKFLSFVTLLLMVVGGAKAWTPVLGKAYFVQVADKSIYLNLNEVDTEKGKYVGLSSTPQALFFTTSGSGFTIQNESGQFMGIDTWNVTCGSTAVTWYATDNGDYVNLSQNNYTQGGNSLGYDTETVGKRWFCNKSTAKDLSIIAHPMYSYSYTISCSTEGGGVKYGANTLTDGASYNGTLCAGELTAIEISGKTAELSLDLSTKTLTVTYSSAETLPMNYVYTWNGVTRGGEIVQAAEGDDFPTPTVSFFGVKLPLPDRKVTHEDIVNGVTIECDLSDFPFEFADSWANINTWYALYGHSQDHKLFYYGENTQKNVQIAYTSADGTLPTDATKNNYLWAFVGNPFDGFHIQNYAAGETLGINDVNATDAGYCDMSGTMSLYYACEISGQHSTGTEYNFGLYSDLSGAKPYLNSRSKGMGHWETTASTGSHWKVVAVEPYVEPVSTTYTVAVTGADNGGVTYDSTDYKNGDTFTVPGILADEEITVIEVAGLVGDATIDGETINVVYTQPKENLGFFNFTNAASANQTIGYFSVSVTPTSGNLQTGTSSYTLSTDNLTALNSNVLLNEGGFTNDAAQSWIGATKGSGKHLNIVISGLTPDYKYNVSFVTGLDKEQAGTWNTVTTTNTYATASPEMGSQSIAAAALTPYQMTDVVANAEGKIELVVNSSNGSHSAVINCLSLSGVNQEGPVIVLPVLDKLDAALSAHTYGDGLGEYHSTVEGMDATQAATISSAARLAYNNDQMDAFFATYGALFTEMGYDADAKGLVKACEDFMASIALNMPNANTFMRIKANPAYISTPTYLASTNTTYSGKETHAAFTTNVDEASIMLWDGTKLVSYTTGLKAIYSSDGAGFIGWPEGVAEGTTVRFAAAANGEEGQYNVIYKNGSNVDRYMYTNVNNYTDGGGAGTAAGYSYVLEEVTELPVTLTEVAGENYATLYLPVGATVSDAAVYAVDDASAGEGILNVTQVVSNEVPANTGVILVGATTSATVALGEVSETATSALQGVTALTEATENVRVFSKKDGEDVAGFYVLPASTTTLKAFHAYYETSNSEVTAFELNWGGTTGIANMLSRKAVEGAYDLQGRKVNNAGRGLHIVDGKKVIK